MRTSKSRSRGNKNRNNRPTGGSIINRVFDSSGPDGKVRGTPQQIIDKYNQLHRDAQLSNDRVNAENFAQHAEHYTRMQAEAQREVDSKREEQEAQNRERQAERDRERNDRLKAQEAAANDPAQMDQPSFTGGDAPQEADIVETPETRADHKAADPVATTPAAAPADAKPPRKPRARKPRPPKPVAAAASDAMATPDAAPNPTPDAAE